jgi:hypothetical protein
MIPGLIQPMQSAIHVCAIRPRKDKGGVNFISDALPFGRLWYCEVSNAIGYAKFLSCSHDAVIEAESYVLHCHSGIAEDMSSRWLVWQRNTPAAHQPP